MVDIKNTLENNSHVSTRLLGELRQPINIDSAHYLEQMAAIMMTVELAAHLGWLEHTSDWDIGAIIKLKNGNTIYVTQGYGDSLTLHEPDGTEIQWKDLDINYLGDQKPYTLRLLKENISDDEEDTSPFKIKLCDIYSICFYT